MWSTLIVLIVAVVVSPVAWLQYRSSGVIVISLAALAVVASIWLAASCTWWFSRDGRSSAGLLAGTGIRMLLPLGLVLALVTIGRGHIEPGSVLYVVPLYFAMLIADTVSAVRRPRAEHNRMISKPGQRNGSLTD